MNNINNRYNEGKDSWFNKHCCYFDWSYGWWKLNWWIYLILIVVMLGIGIPILQLLN